MKRSYPSGRSAGFTRVDLVFLTGMIAVLGLLSLGAAANNRAGNQNATCLANLNDLTHAWQQYALDHGHFPPNPDDGNTTPGYTWVPGQAGIGGAQEFNPDILADTSRSLLFPYLKRADVAVFRCPADLATGKYQGSDPQKRNTIIPAARSYSMNGGVGTDPYSGNGQLAVNGPWLDNNHGNTRNGAWRTYGRFDDIVAPSPDKLAVLFDEDRYSINDGTLAFGMVRAEWIDWPATRHDSGGTLSYADGHVELRHWVDPRTVVRNGNVSRLAVPGSLDYEWLRERMSAPSLP